MDISLLVFAVNRPSSPYHRGDIVDASLMHNGGCRHPRFILVNIVNVPDRAPPDILMKRIKVMLQRNVTIEDFSVEIRRRAWRINYENLPAHIKQTLLADRKITVEWSVAKNYLGKRIVADETRPETDTLSYIKDGDV